MKTPWYVQFDGSEFGPMVEDEIARLLSAGRLQGRIFIWKDGMENWAPVSSHEELKTTLSQGAQPLPQIQSQPLSAPTVLPSLRHQKNAASASLPQGAERRRSSRHTLVATVVLITERGSREGLGVCADVSDEGMQVIAAGDLNKALKVGQMIEVEIQPVSISGLKPFRIKAKTMWVNNPEHRIGLAFETIGVQDRESLKSYLQKKRHESK